MSVWIGPMLIVTAMIVFVSALAIRKSVKLHSLVEGRSEVSEAIEEHPFSLNPIFWVIGIATIFMAIVIFYYATSFY